MYVNVNLGNVQLEICLAGIACTIGSEWLAISKDLVHETAKVPRPREDPLRDLHVLP